MERAILKFFLLFCITLGVINIVLFLPKKTPDKPAIPSPIPSKLTDVLKQIPAPQVFPAEFTPPPPRTDFPAAPTLVKSDDTSLRQEAINYPFEIYNPLPVANSYRYGTKFAPPPSLVPMVEFWRNVYARYNPHHSILHDAQNLSIVYGVIDFEPLESKTLLPKRIKQQWREDIQEEKRETIIDMLLSFHEGNTPKTESEKIIYQLLDKIEGKNKFKNAAERVRIQQGQKSLFEKGIVRSGRYMDQIKRVFARIGVPEEIANLVFVESMFQVDAVSKTG
ncbi:MAG: hypothetical protein Q7S68_00700, partial [Deltaproteobacteria bacterium]|nr:hypothetical protein [Deltaproteobacteria bacterium]